MDMRTRPAPSRSLIVSLVAAGCLAIFAAGCQGPGESPSATGGPTKVKLAYSGLTCEAAMFVAKEKGFFDEEGLDVKFVPTDGDSLREGLGFGKFDANYSMIMYWLKPIEQGLDVKITGGVHSGCLRVQAGVRSEIRSVADLKGKRIGIPMMGSAPFIFTSRVLTAQGMDPTTDVIWKVVAPEVMGLALENDQVDAVADPEPLGSILADRENVRTIVNQAVDAPYRYEYCCATVVSGKFVRSDPSGAAKVTRALLKGAMWVDKNPTAAANLSVEKKYIAASAELNAQAIGKLKFMPSVSRCRESIGLAAKEMKTAGLLNRSTDPAALARRAWIDLEGVTDDWLERLKVEEVAGGGPPPALDGASLAALFAREKDSHFFCCIGCERGVSPELCGR
jgi:NitT/TauT family transport system substrate-binding protein